VRYTTIVRPMLEHGAVAWDPYHKNLVQELEGVQRYAARAASYKWNKYRTAQVDDKGNLVFESVSDMVSELGWQPLRQRRAHTRLVALYEAQAGKEGLQEIKKKLQPANFIGRRDHQYKIQYTAVSKDVGKFAPVHRTVREFNGLPSEAFAGGTRDSFKEWLRAHPYAHIPLTKA
jgi:hypothetical protein